MDKINHIATMIREHRKAAGMTQLELADLSGIGKTTIFDIEKAKPSIRFENILKVLETLNISLHFSSPFIQIQEAKL